MSGRFLAESETDSRVASGATLRRPFTVTSARTRHSIRRWSPFIACLGLVNLGCNTVLRYPTEKLRLDFNEAQMLGERMNRDVLSLTRFRHLVVEVDWVETAAPAELALDALRDTLVEFVPEEYEITIERSDEIPYEEWETVRNEPYPMKLLGGYVDHWTPDPATRTHLYILYLPNLSEGHPANFGYFGHATAELENPETETAEPTSLPFIVLSKGAFRRWAWVWLKAERIERSTMVHELGHFLGLVSNPRHEVRGDPWHCANPACPMSHPRWRSILRNAPSVLLGRFPFEYGEECRRDIEISKPWWQSGSPSEPPPAN